VRIHVVRDDLVAARTVLKELRDTEIVVDGEKLPLLEYVTTISSVSGGSFTSAYYGLYGARIFDDYEDRLLRRDIDARLALSLVRPLEFLRIAFTPYTRSDMAMDVYDREVFGGATFADLANADGPLLYINATDISIGSVFTFMQPNFNMICSDLSELRVAQAVTASSAVPGIFDPIVLENHAGSCGYTEPEWIRASLADPRRSRRRYHDARLAAAYLDRHKRPYVFLVDGGVADNIGARRILSDVIDAGNPLALAEKTNLAIPERLLYIIVNAQVAGKPTSTKKPATPSLRTTLSLVSGTGIYRYNFETIELLRESVAAWSQQVESHGLMQADVVEVAFDYLEDAEERVFFDGIATSFNLDDETIDRLIEVGGRLLRESPDFKDFIAQLQ